MEDYADEINSLESIKRSEIYTSKQLVSEDVTLSIPFLTLSGESVEYLGTTTEGIIAISTFRLFTANKHGFINVPLGLIDNVDKEMFTIYIYCKTGPQFRCNFLTNEKCLEWHKRLTSKIDIACKKVRDSFACAFFAWCIDYADRRPEFTVHKADDFSKIFDREVSRMGFDSSPLWRISDANATQSLCPSYPKRHVVPATMTDEDICQASNFRSMQRFPSVVWKDRRTGMAMARCSQPKQGLLSWRCSADEMFFQQLLQSCPVPLHHSHPLYHHTTTSQVPVSDVADTAVVIGRKVLLIDARSYTSGWANRAKGGGVECPEYYPLCNIVYMNLANIHTIRKSFTAMRTLCTQCVEQPRWLSGLEITEWLLHISGLMKTALLAVNAINVELRPVVVHCSDGWDRTPQIVSLAQLILDPYYRTIEGFCTLVQREWLDFGHKFADRCGHYGGCGDASERCPVFLLWLDCVHQLLIQFPTAFHFNMTFLVKLVQHVYSCLFGTFLTNSAAESEAENIRYTTFSVWSLLLHSPAYVNGLYQPVNQVLQPCTKPQSLQFWQTVYMMEFGPSSGINMQDLPTDHDTVSCAADHADQSLARTRSCDTISKIMATELSLPAETMKRCNSDTSVQNCATRHDHDSNPSWHDDDKLLTADEHTIDSGVACVLRGMSTEASTSTSDLSQVVLRSSNIVDTGHMTPGLRHLLTLHSKCSCAADTPVMCPNTHLSASNDSFTNLQRAVMRLLDADGLTNFGDPIQRRLRDMHGEYVGQLHTLTNQLQAAKRLLDYYRSCNGAVRPSDLRDDVHYPELTELTVDRGEVSSTPASDTSWDQVDEQDTRITLWVPDHVAVDCSACHVVFNIVTRKHHCRKCGRVFCGECTQHMAPLPDQQLNTPVRVCDRCYEALGGNALLHLSATA